MEEPRPSTAERWLALATLLPALVLVGLALAGPIASGDLWWQLRCGQWMLQHHEIPTFDPFSHTAGEREWIPQEYGSQVLFALLHGVGGLEALRIAGTVLSLLLLLAVYASARRHVPPVWAALAVAGFMVLYALKWELRPHLLSSFFVLRLVHVLFPRRRARDPGPRVWIEVLVLTALWVQLHAEAIFSPVLALTGCIGAVLGAAYDREGGLRRVGAWLATFGAALVGVLLSPIGTKPIEYALVKSSAPKQLIEEWVRPFFPALPPGDPGYPWYRPWFGADHPRFLPLSTGVWHAVLGAFAVAALVLGVHAWKRARHGERAGASALSSIPWERLGFLAACVFFALQARRFQWLLWFPALEGLALVLELRPAWRTARAVPALLGLVLALPLWGSHYVRWQRAALTEGRFGDTTHDEYYPVHAAWFVKSADLAGNLFHPYEWGGFLGFRLGQRCPVFVDGRTVLFQEVIAERWSAEHDPAVARRVFAQRNVRVIVGRRFLGAAPWRPGEPDEWTRVWADTLAAVWIRAGDRENLERVIARYRELGIDFDPALGFVEAQVLDAHPEWATALDVVPDFVADELRPTFERTGTAAREARARIYEAYRLPASARWERERARESEGEGAPGSESASGDGR